MSGRWRIFKRPFDVGRRARAALPARIRVKGQT
jgi:hypothetical protein